MESRYNIDVDGLEMFSEIMDCKQLLRTVVKLEPPEDLLRFAVQYGDKAFPDLRIGI